MNQPPSIYRCSARMIEAPVISLDGSGTMRLWSGFSSNNAPATTGWLRIYEDRLVFKAPQLNPKEIPVSEIGNAMLISVAVLKIPCRILWLRYGYTIVSFTVLADKFWDFDLPFPVIRHHSKQESPEQAIDFIRSLLEDFQANEALAV